MVLRLLDSTHCWCRPDLLMGATFFFLLSCVSLVVTAQAQDCPRPTLQPNINFKDKDILLQTFPDGSKINLACDVGYTPAGGSTAITCTAGSWSDVKLRCEKKTCSAPGEVGNGNIQIDTNEYGGKATVTCNAGYRLVGKAAFYCGDSGWMGRSATCEAVVCAPPATIQNGYFSPQEESYTYNQVVQYSCEKDYTLNGSASLACSEDESFQPKPPKCVRVQCTLPTVPFADRTGPGPPYRHKATLTFECKSGYTMVGSGTLICEINNQWSPGIPRCDVERIPPKPGTTTTTKATTPKAPTTSPTIPRKPTGLAPTVPTGKGNNVGLGVGLGLALATCLAVGCLYFFIKRKKSGKRSSPVGPTLLAVKPTE